MKQLLIALTLVIGSMPAFANAIFTLGNHHQVGEENILFHSDQTGMTVQEFDHFGTDVQFASTTDTLVGTGGQSDIDSLSGLIHNVTITVPGHTFGDFIFNPFEPVVKNDLFVSVLTNDGTFTFNYGDTHGNNFLTITTTAGEVIDSITLTSASGFADLRQPRISGVSGEAAVPEPSSLVLAASGFLGIAATLRLKLGC
jgi:hypothetical protein